MRVYGIRQCEGCGTCLGTIRLAFSHALSAFGLSLGYNVGCVITNLVAQRFNLGTRFIQGKRGNRPERHFPAGTVQHVAEGP